MKKLFLVLMSILLLSGSAHALELSKGELFWLAQNIYWESRDQTIQGQINVALVTINRQQDHKWPDTIKDVVIQKDQFSWYWDGKSDIPKEYDAWVKSKQVAEIVCSLYNYLEPEHRKVFWYHRYDIDWKYKEAYTKYARIDDHIFYND